MRILILLTAAGIGLATGLFLLHPEDPDRRNAFMHETAPLKMGVLPPEDGVTLALIDKGPASAPHVLLVTDVTPQSITGLDLTAQGLTSEVEFFQVIEQIGLDRLRTLASVPSTGETSFPLVSHPYTDLLPAAGTASRHIASGTNFPEHQEETQAQSVFNFPKFGAATPPVTTVSVTEHELLDYEVEICARFDRDIKSVEDFDQARKGFFLCGDFSDRAALMRLIDPDNLDSGKGFSDAKSGPDHFPSGGVFVVPRDWRRFVETERLTTSVNGEPRQDTRAGDMILSFRDLVEKILADTTEARFLYQSRYWHLVEDARIAQGQVLMSGTAEGVIFMPPSLRQILRGSFRYVIDGHVLKGRTPYQAVVETFLNEERKSYRFLQPGDRVSHRSSHMGMISALVVQATIGE
ncbi:2-keto-4-pentenoate hydratase [Epibacterium sp. SM1979]|uniref:2-keto-4-pentenoate hydratase n=1 Tax=Tritonibacter litoralis TaxID=2662264 RepID=A0A843YAY2_9RHOB|nr:fumarylacetoacetate hydrolase family protein [Tritonibacter litoralis]MQQ08470.1 2-keto-4-pentenoate hydratase [Tritonibacter litoralis]